MLEAINDHDQLALWLMLLAGGGDASGQIEFGVFVRSNSWVA
jgi:hypothetical protein